MSQLITIKARNASFALPWDLEISERVMNHRHRKSLHALFAHPISGNISMKDVAHVFEELGASLDHGHGGKLTVRLNGHAVSFHGHGHSLGKDEVVQVRKFIENCGVDPVRDFPL